MKKLSLMLWLFLLGIPMVPTLMARTYYPVVNTKANGATSIAELANGIVQAIQSHDFDQLSAYLITDAELAALKRQPSADLQAVITNTTAADLKNHLKSDYDALLQEGVNRTVNWSALTLAESKAGKGSPKTKLLQPVLITLTNKENQAVQVAFETIKINGRYFLFRQMKLQA